MIKMNEQEFTQRIDDLLASHTKHSPSSSITLCYSDDDSECLDSLCISIKEITGNSAVYVEQLSPIYKSVKSHAYFEKEDGKYVAHHNNRLGLYQLLLGYEIDPTFFMEVTQKWIRKD